MKRTLKLMLLALLLVFPLATLVVYAADFEASPLEAGGALVYDDGVIQVYEMPFESPATKLLPEATADPVITWLAFPLANQMISNGFKLGTTIAHTIWTASLKAGKATVKLTIVNLSTGKTVKSVSATIPMTTAGKTYTVAYNYKEAAKGIYFFQGTVLFTGVTQATNINTNFCKFFIY